jgi:hypothetical protein
MFTRTLKWDVTNLRFWWLGDEPLPSQWDVWIYGIMNGIRCYKILRGEIRK